MVVIQAIKSKPNAHSIFQTDFIKPSDLYRYDLYKYRKVYMYFTDVIYNIYI
jgi:hypothetical protein